MRAINSINANISSSIPANINYFLKLWIYQTWYLSHIKCFTCGEIGHYATIYNQDQPPLIVISIDLLKVVPANMIQLLVHYYQLKKKYF